tara:strand:+ start:93 stop:362 length:270 start_codon:yes stop_codon:yes gene_type:complete
MIKSMIAVSFLALMLSGCAASKSNSSETWFGHAIDEIEHEADEIVDYGLGSKPGRYVAAAGLLLVVGLGCWSRFSEGKRIKSIHEESAE